LSMLRGVYQAIATLAFVQIVLSINLGAESLTNGPFGINSIPNVATTPILIATLAVVMVLLAHLNRSGIGRAFDAIRQDETVAVCLGVSVFKFHFLAFSIAGALAGLGGALEAYNSYSIAPNSFGFSMLVGCLAFVVLGGRTSLWGPVVGAALLTMLPELFRPLADYRMMAHGILLVLVMAYLENGIVDTILFKLRNRRLVRSIRDNVQPTPELSA
jgi:branched-chain amino acid transport system permease protein